MAKTQTDHQNNIMVRQYELARKPSERRDRKLDGEAADDVRTMIFIFFFCIRSNGERRRTRSQGVDGYIVARRKVHDNIAHVEHVIGRARTISFRGHVNRAKGSDTAAATTISRCPSRTGWLPRILLPSALGDGGGGGATVRPCFYLCEFFHFLPRPSSTACTTFGAFIRMRTRSFADAR